MDTVRPLYTKPMDEEHCVIAVPNGICEIHEPQIKRRYNVFLICPAARPLSSAGHQNPAAAPVETTLQKYKQFTT